MDSLYNLDRQGPTTTSFLDLLQQGPPQREDYKASLGAKISALLGAGALGALGKPEQGSALGMQILDSPYSRALEDYNRQASYLAQGANLESARNKNVMGLLPDLLKAREAGMEFGVTSRQNQQKIENDRTQLDNTARYQQGQLENQKAEMLQRAAEAKVDQAIKAGQLDVSQREAATRELLAKAQAKFYEGSGRQTSQPKTEPTDLLKTQLMNEALTNPILMKYFDKNTRQFDFQALQQDPPAIAQWQFLARKYGLMK